jgi:hypothetical protein
MKTESLLTETPGSELHATWEVLAALGATREGLKRIRSNRELAKKIVQLMGPSMELADQIKRWQSIFDKAGITCDTSKVKIPDQKPGFDRLIIVPKGMTLSQMNNIMRLFNVWLYTSKIKSLDDFIPKNDRSNENVSYAIWVRDRVESDEEHINCSAEQIARMKIHGITALERLLYELIYFTETGRHLDVVAHTLCTGSRNYIDGVPLVFWEPGLRKVSLSHCREKDIGKAIRTREVTY